jgi:hypothetical protein
MSKLEASSRNSSESRTSSWELDFSASSSCVAGFWKLKDAILDIILLWSAAQLPPCGVAKNRIECVDLKT